MNPKPVIPRQGAVHDVEEAVSHHLDMGGREVAHRFVDALEDAYDILGRCPGAGSPRFAVELDIPGLRTWALRRFPYLIFYVEADDCIDVWRVVHSWRDIPELMQGADTA